MVPQASQHHRPVSLLKRARFRFETAAVQCLVWWLPKLRRSTLVKLARVAGWCGYYLMRGQRRIALANLDVAFGGTKTRSEKKWIARQSMQQFAVTLFGLFGSERLTAENVRSVVEVDPVNLAYAQRLKADGRGIIWVTLHFGDWEMLGLASGFLGLDAHIVTETMRNQRVLAILERLRSRTGNVMVLQRGAAVRLYKALRKGHSIALLIDMNAPDSSGGMWLDFFGLPVFNSTAVAALALRTKARLVASRAYALPGGRVRVEYGPEIPYEATGDDEADIRRISQDCLRHCENVIREKPECWLWMYKRWKYRMGKRPGYYPFYTARFNMRSAHRAGDIGD